MHEITKSILSSASSENVDNIKSGRRHERAVFGREKAFRSHLVLLAIAGEGTRSSNIKILLINIIIKLSVTPMKHSTLCSLWYVFESDNLQ